MSSIKSVAYNKKVIIQCVSLHFKLMTKQLGNQIYF